MARSAYYPPTRYQDELERMRVARSLASSTQSQRRAMDNLSALQQRKAELVASGVHPAQLPELHAGMSQTDLAAAGRAMGPAGTAFGGRALVNDPQSPMGLPKVTAPDGKPLVSVAHAGEDFNPSVLGNPSAPISVAGRAATPQMDRRPMVLSGTRAPDADQMKLIRASRENDLARRTASPSNIPGEETPAQLADANRSRAFYGRPLRDATPGTPLWKTLHPEAPSGSAVDPTAARVAGTGQIAQTPYGTISSRTEGNTAVAKSDPNQWQRDLVKRYPQVGVAGSPENAAFVAKYKEMQSRPNAGQLDPHALADSLFAPKPNSADTAVAKVEPPASTPPVVDPPAKTPQQIAYDKSIGDLPGVGAARSVVSGARDAVSGVQGIAGGMGEDLADFGRTVGNIGRSIVGSPLKYPAFNGYTPPPTPPSSFPDPPAISYQAPALPSSVGGSNLQSNINYGAPTVPSSPAVATPSTPPQMFPGWNPPSFSAPRFNIQTGVGNSARNDVDKFSENPNQVEFEKRKKYPTEYPDWMNA